jgi:putative phosphoribosyl transferase
MNAIDAQLIQIPVDDVHVEGVLTLPGQPSGLVLFAHGRDSSRHDPHNTAVTQALHAHRMGTLVLDLLTVAEMLDYHTRFDISLLTHRLLVVTGWVKLHASTLHLPLGYFGASTGAAAALQAAAAMDDDISAVVCRGGRPDLAGHHDLSKVTAPALLLVGSRDEEVLALNNEACAQLNCIKSLSIVAGASHLFDEPGALDAVAQQATQWFAQHLPR